MWRNSPAELFQRAQKVHAVSARCFPDACRGGPLFDAQVSLQPWQLYPPCVKLGMLIGGPLFLYGPEGRPRRVVRALRQKV